MGAQVSPGCCICETPSADCEFVEAKPYRALSQNSSHRPWGEAGENDKFWDEAEEDLRQNTDDTTGGVEIEATVEYSQTACEESVTSALTDELSTDETSAMWHSIFHPDQVWMEDDRLNRMSPIAESEASFHFEFRQRFGFPQMRGDLGSVVADSSSASIPGSDGSVSPHSEKPLAMEDVEAVEVVRPVQPVESVDSVELVDSVDSVDPVDPVDTVDPVEPVKALGQEDEHAVAETHQEVSRGNDSVIDEAKTPALDTQPADSQVTAETRDQFLERAASCIRQAGIADEGLALFESFQSTDDLGLTFATFARMQLHAARSPVTGDSLQPVAEHHDAGLQEEAPRFPYQLFQELLGNNWKAKKLWKLLDERVCRPEYTDAPLNRGRLNGRHCLVVGAGPCGLRAAIELRLLGAQVTVVERRDTFSRINQLHIWSWVGEDLRGLGARMIEPPPKDFGSNPDLLVIGINDLQKLLLKVALLLGVDVRLGLEYCDTKWGENGWQTLLRPPSDWNFTEGRAGPAAVTSQPVTSNSRPPSQFLPGLLQKLAVVIGCGGFASSFGDNFGIRNVETESLRKESAIGLICNVARTHGRSEADLRSFSMARQFYMSLFRQAAEETGVDLENIVYVKSPVAHYFVMTPTPKSLISTGVVIDESYRPLLARENINKAKLDEVVRRVIAFGWKQGVPSLLEALSKDLGGEQGGFPGYADSGPRLFDFSKMRRSSEGLIFLRPTGHGPAEVPEEEDDSLLVALAGDALMEPFWPEGLGIMRGFFGVLDACHAARAWSDGLTCSEVQELHGAAFQKLKTLSAATRARVLQQDEKKYCLSPETRYR